MITDTPPHNIQSLVKGNNSLTAKAIFVKIELDLPLLIRNHIFKFQNPMLNDFLSIIRKRKYYSKFGKKNSNSLTAKAIFLKIELDFPLLIKKPQHM